MAEEYVEINTESVKKSFGKAKTFFSNKKVQNVLLIILLLSTLVAGSLIRTQNLDLLKDQTTGEYIPLALDPFYFLRISETILNQGSLPAVDNMRYPAANVGFTNEILPQAVVLIYNMANIFGDYSLQYINVISPVIFFALGLIIFFFLVLFLTNSKATALISSIFLAFIPPYLYRTMAGFSDHEAIGMVAFFLALAGYTLAMKFLDNEKVVKNGKIKTILWGIGTGILSALVVASWGGVANFIFLIVPVSFALFWLIKTQDWEVIRKDQMISYLMFYASWIVSTLLAGVLLGYPFENMVSRTLLRPTSLGVSAVFAFIIVDFFVIKYKNKIRPLDDFFNKNSRKRYRALYSLLITLLVGTLFLLIQGNLFQTISDLINRLLHPFGSGRIGLTVSENRQPFLQDWIAQVGKVFFWMFVAGMSFVGINLSKGIRKKQNRLFFSAIWIAMILGILFSRISPNSLLNGTNFISRLLYFGVLAVFVIYSIWVYFNDRIEVKPEILIIASWLLFTLIAGRGAIRLLFVITPFAAFMGGYALTNIFAYSRRKGDDLYKMFMGILVIFVLFAGIISLFGIPGNSSFPGFIKTTDAQAKSTGPSAEIQWQGAMEWVRENTPGRSIFVHWWDYGYWVQYLGERPTVTDGGHAIGYWDHLIGRYLLTTPMPETALSFMKTHDVSYLLIDPTDLGKYGAYSRIGSGPEGEDRYSQIPTMFPDSSQTRETNNTITRIYQGIAPVDEDIVYHSEENGEIFLPRENAFIIGTILESDTDGSLLQPSGVFYYNNQQIQIPLRYAHSGGELIDFENGLEATAYILPSASLTNSGVNINSQGALIYLSPKVSESLFVQLYLMGDPHNRYPTITLAHSEQDPLVRAFNSQGVNVEFIYYNGFRGPIKIWSVDYPSDIIENEEFLMASGEYAEFDDLQFTR